MDRERLARFRWPILFVAFGLLAGAVYVPALSGLLFSDDVGYIAQNEYVRDLNAANLRAIFDPYGGPGKMTQNYAPVHLLMHSIAWQGFGSWLVGHHLLGVFFHVVASTLLTMLFVRSKVPLRWALAGGTLFLLHPANVEAVAWVSQLKSNAGLSFALAAILLQRRRPGVSVVFFTLGLLTKALTAFALPVAALFEWVYRTPLHHDEDATARDASARRRVMALLGWGIVLGIYGAVEFPVFRYTNANVAPLAPDVAGLLRAVVAIAGHYLFMATTGWGVSAFQEAPGVDSWLALRWLLAIPVLAVLAARLFVTLRERREEGVYWAWAAISFAPVSQVFPFLHPVADRYLYFILPGLIGGALGVALELARRLEGNRAVARLALGWLLVLLTIFAVRSHERAALFGSPALLDEEAIRNFPHGLIAHQAAAQEAATRGDMDGVESHLRFVIDRGHIEFFGYRDPVWDRVRGDPRFEALLREMAARWLRLEPLYVRPSQIELRGLAHAHLMLGQWEEAERKLELALEVGGLRDEQVRRELASVRVRLERSREEHE